MGNWLWGFLLFYTRTIFLLFLVIKMRISTRQLLRNKLSIWAITGSSTIITGGFHFIPSSWSIGNQCSTFSSTMKSENQIDIPDISTWKWIGLFENLVWNNKKWEFLRSAYPLKHGPETLIVLKAGTLASIYPCIKAKKKTTCTKLGMPMQSVGRVVQLYLVVKAGR